jgi:hypothetical protein
MFEGKMNKKITNDNKMTIFFVETLHKPVINLTNIRFNALLTFLRFVSDLPELALDIRFLLFTFIQ